MKNLILISVIFLTIFLFSLHVSHSLKIDSKYFYVCGFMLAHNNIHENPPSESEILEAIEYYSKAIALKDDPEYFSAKAECYLKLNDYQTAESLINEALGKGENDNPKIRATHFFLLDSYFKQGLYKKALNYCDKIIEIYPDSRSAYRTRCELLFILKKHDEALIAHNKFSKTEYKKYDEIYQLVFYSPELSSYLGSHKFIFYSTENGKNNEELYLKSIIQIEKGEFELAFDNINRIEEIEVNDSILFDLKAVCLYNLSNKEEAIKLYKKAFSSLEEHEERLKNLTVVTHSENIRKTLEELDKIIQ